MIRIFREIENDLQLKMKKQPTNAYGVTPLIFAFSC